MNMKTTALLTGLLCCCGIASIHAGRWIDPWDPEDQATILAQWKAPVTDPVAKLEGYKTRLARERDRIAANARPEELDLYEKAMQRIEYARTLALEKPSDDEAQEGFRKAWYATKAALVQVKTVVSRAWGDSLMIDIAAVLQRLDKARDSISSLAPEQVVGLRRAQFDPAAERKAVEDAAQQRLCDLAGDHIAVSRADDAMHISVSDILFEVNKASLSPDLKTALRRIAGILKVFDGARVAIEGHTDNTGNRDFNRKLSELRADNVAQFLAMQGIDQKRLAAKGFGFTRPVAPNDTEEGRRKNRRVDLIIRTADGQ